MLPDSPRLSVALYRSLLIAVAAFAVPAAVSAEVVLAAPGAMPAPIILPKDTTPSNRRAANELADYIGKISGAKPLVIEGEPRPMPAHAVWVGFQPRLKTLFPKTNFDFQRPEEILIAAGDDHLVIAGRDRWDPEHRVIASPHGNLDHQFEYGTCNAVYTFIQERLGVRWLWPGADGEDVPHREKISFEPFEYHYQPPLLLRRGVMWWLCRPASRGKLAADWSRYQRIYLDSSNNLLTLLNEGHAFDTWWNRFHEQHPEYFALQPDGTRSGYPAPDRVKMCLSNPAVADQWIADVARILEQNPTQTYFNAAENDNHVSGYCVCPNCTAWDSPTAPKYRLYWNKFSEERPAMSDRQVHFANIAARKLKERYPDKDYKVVIYAYGPSASAPVDVKPDANVLVAHVPNMWDDLNFRDRWSAAPARNADQITAWAAMGANLVWRPNLTSTAGLYQGLPDVPLTRTVDCFKHTVVKNHVSGVGLAAFSNFWPTQGPLYYVLAQLAWNPKLEPGAILDDYYQRGFGPAAATVKSYWSFMEEKRNRTYDESLPFAKAYDDAFFARATALLDEADRIIASAPEIYRRRVAHVRSGLEYTRRVIEVRTLKDRYEAGGKKDNDIAVQLRTKIAELTREGNGSMDRLMGPVIPSLYLDRWLPEAIEKVVKKDLQ